MRKIYLYITLIISLLSIRTMAAPRLTVIAVVDGLTAENLATLRPYWQQGGLRTLSEEAYQTSLTYPHMVYGGNETTATLMTGVSPDRHGYTMDTFFARQDRAIHPMLDDETTRGIGTAQKISPKNLLSQTITDRMRLMYPEAKIYAIGLQPATTVLLAGHASNACCWIDEKTKQWVATAAYSGGLPSAAYDQNRSGRITTLAARQWIPRMDIATYTCPTPQERKKSFQYTAGDVLLHSPQANTLIIDSDRISSAEQEDMYLCLNQDLGFLMEQLDKRIGRTNYQLLVIGRPVLGTDPQTLSDIHMPVQQFNADRAAALTGTYLMALYGHERWVDGAYGQSIYLNRTLIEQKRLSFFKIGFIYSINKYELVAPK